MGYDFYFGVRDGKTPPTVEQVRAHFAARPPWRLTDDGAEYEHALTGIAMAAAIRAPEADEPAGRAPLILYVDSTLRPHVALLELAEELGAVARTFDLSIDEAPFEERYEFEPKRVLLGIAKHDRWLHENYLAAEGNDPPPSMPRARLEEVWRWNRKRDALAAGADDRFVPQIFFKLDGDVVGTFIAWADGTAARVPRVDSIQTTRTHVPWSVIEEAIAAAPFADDHWIVDGAVCDRVFAAIAAAPGGPPPERLAAPRVLTKELVDELVLPPDVRPKQQEVATLTREGRFAVYRGEVASGLKKVVRAANVFPDRWQLQHDAAVLAHEANEPAVALKMAKRALALDPSSDHDGLIAAANAMYLARYAEALRYADGVVAIDPNDRNAHLVRATALTDLMRWDEAIAACERALAIENDGMAENVKAFALAAAGRASEAKATYERALASIESALKESPDEAELHGRRAYALLGLGRAKLALAAAKKALVLEEGEFLSLQSLGRALVALDEPSAALVPLLAAMKLRPAPMAAFYAAKAYAKLGDAKGRNQALRALEASPYFVHCAKTDADLAPRKRGANAVRAPSKRAASKSPAAKKRPAPKRKLTRR